MRMITLVSLDPNETAKDMTDRYKTECANSKVRPIAKLLEQLEVSPSLQVSCAKFNLEFVCCDSGWMTPAHPSTLWTSKVSSLSLYTSTLWF